MPWTVMFCSGQSHHRLIEIHTRYGSVVRVGPNELSYTVPEAWEAIMCTRKASLENPKAPWFCSPESKHIAAAPWDDHNRMRRIISPSLSKNSIVQQQPLIKSYVDLLIQRLVEKTAHGRTEIEIDRWVTHCAFDIIGDLSLGEPFGCLRESATHPWISMIFANLRAGAIGVALKRFPLLRVMLPLLVPSKLQKLGVEMKQFIHEKVARRLATGSSRPDFIEAMSSKKGGLVSVLHPKSIKSNRIS